MNINMNMRVSAAFAFSMIISFGLLAGCAKYDQATRELVSNITPYRIDIVQGQLVTSEQLAQIKLGMSREDVVARLGSPSVESPWAPQEMSYVFSYKNGYKTIVENSSATFIFDASNKLIDSKTSNIFSEKQIIQKIDKK